MAAKRPYADLDLTQEERQTSDSIRRSSYPAAYTTASVPFVPTERPFLQSTTASRSARTLPLPSPTWFSPTNTFPVPHVPPPWDLTGSQVVPQRSPIQGSVSSSIDNAQRGLQVDYGSLVKKDPCSPPPSGLDSDEATQSLVNERSRPDTERQRLRSEITLLQLQIEDLQQQIDLFRHQATRKDDQYLQIIDQSKRREMQGLTDSQRWQEDRKQWADERQVLLQTIAGLNTKLGQLVHHTDYSRDKNTSDTPPAQRVSSFRALPKRHVEPSVVLPPQDVVSQQMTISPSSAILPAGEESLYGPSTSSPRGGTDQTETPWSQLRYESGRLADNSMELMKIARNIRLQLDRADNAKDMDAAMEGVSEA